MNTKDNARARATDEKIVRAMFQAMVNGKKPVNKITVREICAATGINRSTFYAHYLDVYDVMEQVEKTMAQGLTQSFLEKLDHGGDLGECFQAIFTFVGEYRDFYALYFNETNRAGVVGVAWELLQDRLQGVDFREFGFRSQAELEYHGEFFISGMTAMLRHWVNTGCKETPRELVEILSRQYNQNVSLFRWDGRA